MSFIRLRKLQFRPYTVRPGYYYIRADAKCKRKSGATGTFFRKKRNFFEKKPDMQQFSDLKTAGKPRKNVFESCFMLTLRYPLKTVYI